MKKKNKWLIYSPEKFSNGQKAFNMILTSQKYIFFIKKKKWVTRLIKMKYTTKTILCKKLQVLIHTLFAIFCGRWGHISCTCPLKKSPHVAQDSKLFWIPKKKNVNPLGPKKNDYQRLPNLFCKDPCKKKEDMLTLKTIDMNFFLFLEMVSLP